MAFPMHRLDKIYYRKSPLVVSVSLLAKDLFTDKTNKFKIYKK